MTENNIILIGFMGAGKTTVGKEIAKSTKKQFIDTDDMIVKQMNLSINDIFERYGEQYFRSLETKLMENLSKSDVECVISCGGGMPLKEENRQLLKNIGTVVYLRTGVQAVMKRLKNDKTRPLLMGSKDEVKEKIKQMHKERDPIYKECADFIIETGKMSVSEVCDKILEL